MLTENEYNEMRIGEPVKIRGEWFYTNWCGYLFVLRTTDSPFGSGTPCWVNVPKTLLK